MRGDPPRLRSQRRLPQPPPQSLLRRQPGRAVLLRHWSRARKFRRRRRQEDQEGQQGQGQGEGQGSAVEALLRQRSETLPHHQRPRWLQPVDGIPRTATGKLQKFKLRAPYWEGRDRQIN